MKKKLIKMKKKLIKMLEWLLIKLGARKPAVVHVMIDRQMDFGDTNELPVKGNPAMDGFWKNDLWPSHCRVGGPLKIIQKGDIDNGKYNPVKLYNQHRTMDYVKKINKEKNQ